ncbi:hypothetical protein AS156_17245 [Bradyrhizobium macuxiense]|uniref:Uncharacterized protein n=2 Tax=Bradyrhizobium macuxiense TaxID=1755647 RepID=A0A109JH75_9BRAD|nr:hypothetical protein AS156_17245 [Bradyrhizobium macuxiense]
MTMLPALRQHTPPEPRLERLSFADRDVGLTRRSFLLGCLGLVAGQVANVLGRLEQLPLLRIRFP